MSEDDHYWYLFKQVNTEPNEWTFRHLEEDGEDDIACVENSRHRFVIRTTLVQRDRTADRYYTVYYEPANADPLDEGDYSDKRVPLHQSTDESIARNNVSWSRESVEEHADPHVVVVREDDERTVYDVPSASIASKATEIYTRIRLDTERDIRALEYRKEEWEERLELEREVAAYEGDSA